MPQKAESSSKHLLIQTLNWLNRESDPVFQGTNSILTAGFIIVLLLCCRISYWILSIQSRELQFAYFRTMGMSMREILYMLINEQLLISGMSIGAGVGGEPRCAAL